MGGGRRSLGAPGLIAQAVIQHRLKFLLNLASVLYNALYDSLKILHSLTGVSLAL